MTEDVDEACHYFFAFLDFDDEGVLAGVTSLAFFAAFDAASTSSFGLRLKLDLILPNTSGFIPWLRMMRYCCEKVIVLLAIQ